jgi:hypothetical protein
MPVILLMCCVVLSLMAGCASTADLTQNADSMCEIHGCQMTVQEVKCRLGTFENQSDNYVAMQSQFPHHGRERYSEDHGYLYAKRMRVYVCDECTKAYDRWQSELKISQQGNLTP